MYRRAICLLALLYQLRLISDWLWGYHLLRLAVGLSLVATGCGAITCCDWLWGYHLLRLASYFMAV